MMGSMNVNVQILDKINMVTDENNITTTKSNNKLHCTCQKKMSHLTLNNNSIVRQQQSNSERPTKRELYSKYLEHTRPNSHKIAQTYDCHHEEIMEDIKEGNNVVSDEEDAIQKFSYEILLLIIILDDTSIKNLFCNMFIRKVVGTCSFNFNTFTIT